MPVNLERFIWRSRYSRFDTVLDNQKDRCCCIDKSVTPRRRCRRKAAVNTGALGVGFCMEHKTLVDEEMKVYVGKHYKQIRQRYAKAKAKETGK